MDLFRKTSNLYLRTEKHPLVEDLIREGIIFKSFDYLYERSETFEEVYTSIVNVLLNAAAKEGEIVYAVPGHPMVAEKTVEMLLESAGNEFEVDILPAMSCLDAIYAVLRLDPTRGLVIRDCLDIHGKNIDITMPMLCTQLYNRRIASEVKLTLMEYYPENYPVKVVHAAKVLGQEYVKEISLYELDRLEFIDHLTSLFVPAAAGPAEKNSDFSFDTLVNVMAKLRSPEGCPWDREQDHRSLKRYLVEETYEVIEAIEEGNVNKLQEELGDLLLQVIFHAQIAKENGQFEIGDVVKGITEKLLRRHPHVFGTVNVKGVEEVNTNWEKIKNKENKDRPRFDVPLGLPALMRAEKVQRKAADVGFDWPDIEGAWAKVEEELDELRGAVGSGPREAVVSEMGDLLFAVVNVSRFLEVDPEEALSLTVKKFVKRFGYIEDRLRAEGKRPEDLSLKELDELWEESKK